MKWRSCPLITGIVAGTIAYFMYRKEFGKKPMPIELTEQVPGEDKAKQVEITGMSGSLPSSFPWFC